MRGGRGRAGGRRGAEPDEEEEEDDEKEDQEDEEEKEEEEERAQSRRPGRGFRLEGTDAGWLGAGAAAGGRGATAGGRMDGRSDEWFSFGELHRAERSAPPAAPPRRRETKAPRTCRASAKP